MGEPTFLWVDIDLIEPNDYNPNLMDGDMFAKAIASIHKFGFVDPVTCREIGERFQIIDGEHRWRAGKDHSGACKAGGHVGLRQLPVTNLGVLTDPIAQQLTIVLNETRGEVQPKKLGELLTTLLISEPLPKLLEVLPFTQARFEELAELPKVDWNTVKAPVAPIRDERWVERVYRLPTATAATLDEAIKEAKGSGAPSDWEALLMIAQGYLDE